MKSKGKFLVLSLALLLAVASGTAWANDTTYSPSTKTIEGTKAFTDTYVLTITSPTSLGGPPPGNPIPSAGVTVQLEITVIDFPSGSSEAEALSFISLDPTSLHFTALNQGQTVDVDVNVGSSATPGDYVYNILAKKPTGQTGIGGWGNGAGATLNLTVNEPVETDTTPPSVTITSPTSNQAFAFCQAGTAVPIAFDATDAESVITGMAADVNGDGVSLTTSGIGTNSASATGTYNATSIGSYTLTASAQSAGGIGDATSVFTVNYNLSWLPPLSLGKTAKGGSTIPVKFTVRDCDGNFIHDESVKVVVYEVSNGQVEAFSGLFGEGASSVRIDDLTGQYIINFQTESGIHMYRVDVFFSDSNGDPFKQGEKSFAVR